MFRFQQRGFTLTELILVIVVVGIAAAHVLPRMTQISQDLRFNYLAQSIASDLRYTQSLAMSWGQTLEFSTTSTSYRVQCVLVGSGPCIQANTAVIDPGHHGTFSVTLPVGITITTNIAANQRLRFNSLGRPNLGVIFSLQSGNRLQQITVKSETGWVSVN